MTEPVKSIEGSDTWWYRVQHGWIGSDGFGGVIVEGMLLIVMGIFFACLIPFSWCCEKWWRVYEPFERLAKRARQDR